MSRLGPGELRLSDIAGEAGVTASALVQRFGSKRELLLALAQAWSDSPTAMFADLRNRHASALGALREYARCLGGLASSPSAFARNLAYLHVDLTDEDFRRTLEAHARRTRSEIARLLASAMAAGELDASADPEALARTVETILAGSLMTWAHYRDGAADRWILADLDAVLGPYLS